MLKSLNLIENIFDKDREIIREELYHKDCNNEINKI